MSDDEKWVLTYWWPDGDAEVHGTVLTNEEKTLLECVFEDVEPAKRYKFTAVIA